MIILHYGPSLFIGVKKKKRNSQLERFQNLQLTFGFANPYFKRGQTWEEKLDIAVQKKISIVYHYKQ